MYDCILKTRASDMRRPTYRYFWENSRLLVDNVETVHFVETVETIGTDEAIETVKTV